MEEVDKDIVDDLKKFKGRPRKLDEKPKQTMYDKKTEQRKDAINNTIVDVLQDLDLTETEKNFILYYLERQNATQAYLLAYNREHDNVPKAQAALQGYIVLRRPRVKSAITKIKKLMSIGFEVDPTKYIEQQLKIANADIGDYIKFSEEEMPMYNEDGTLMFDPDTGEQKFKKVNRMHLVDSETVDTSVIKAIKQGREGISIELVDKQKAWENIKNFFEWKVKKEEKEAQDNSLIEAISKSAKGSWEEETAYEDLDKALKDNEEG